MLFGVVFVRRSSAISSDAFTQTDATHWVLNLSALAGDAACTDVRDVCLFVPGGCSLPPDAGLSCHVSSGAAFEYRGYVSNETPSDVFPTAWPLPVEGQSCLSYQLGVTLEPLSELRTREATAVASRLEYAKRVALDLFRFVVCSSAAQTRQ